MSMAGYELKAVVKDKTDVDWNSFDAWVLSQLALLGDGWQLVQVFAAGDQVCFILKRSRPTPG